MGWNDHIDDGPDPEPIADYLGLSLEEFEAFGVFNLDTHEGQDGTVHGYFLRFDDPIPLEYAGGLSGLRDDRTIWLPLSVFPSDPEPDWIDDIPFADPQIQKDYEAALGKFMVRFNRIENLVSKLIERTLERQALSRLSDHLLSGNLNQRILALSALFPHPPGVPAKTLTKLLARRNILAHGHFDQDPFEGDYRIVTSKGKPHEMGPAQIEALCIDADRLWTELRHLEAILVFSDTKV